MGMSCLEDGQMLLFLEGELSSVEEQRVRNHVASCLLCRASLLELEKDLGCVRVQIGELFEQSQTLPVQGETRVWQKVQARITMHKKEGIMMKMKKTALVAAAVIALALVGSMPSVQAIAANLLQVFRVQQVDFITLKPGDLNKIQEALDRGDESITIEDFGTFATEGTQDPKTIPAAELNRMSFPTRLPAVLSEEVRCSVQEPITVSFTPRVENINGFLRSLQSETVFPESMDGKTCRLVINKTLIIEAPEYTMVQCEAPRVEVPDDVNVAQVRAALLSLPFWPEQVRSQLEAVEDWQHTLVVPAENVTRVSIRGNSGVLSTEGNSQQLIWSEDGMLYYLEKDLNQDADLKEIAESLR